MNVPSALPSRELTLLFVEDNEFFREIGMMSLSHLFKRIVMAEDGEEGLRLFHECAPDIIVTDQQMPGLSGMEMLAQIRMTDRLTPVVLMTGNIDHQLLVKAINLGVTQFIPKPFKFDLMVQALDDISQRIANERFHRHHQQQEMELLRYRDQYNSMQQEAAVRKERHVVRHDLRFQTVSDSRGNRWGVDVAHVSRDIMCGDGYSICRLSDDRVMVFLIDAMGSGLSASLTTLLATSFCNFHFEHFFHFSGYEFSRMLGFFTEYIAGILLDDEVVSCGFLLIDLANLNLETALFALPPLLVRDLDGSVSSIRSKNPPLSPYSGAAATTSFSLENVADLLLVSDGFSDAELSVEGQYREHLLDDYIASPTLASLLELFHSRVGASYEQDDRTMLHIRRIDLPRAWHWSCPVPPRYDALHGAIATALERLDREMPLSEQLRDELELMLSEALTNAYEHGCLRIDSAEKKRIMLTGEYEDFLETCLPPDGSAMSLSLSLWRGMGLPLLSLEIRDSGSGIPLAGLGTADSLAVCGRGLRMIDRYCDSLFVGGPSGCLIILKTI